MAVTILDCDRFDCYEFEVFIGHLVFTKPVSQKLEGNFNENNEQKSSKQEESNSSGIPKYTIKTTLGDIIKMNISNYHKDEEDHEDMCLVVYDGLKPKDSLVNIVKQLAKRYIVEEKPVCTAQNICYNIVYNESANGYSTKPSINKGSNCIFASIPKMFVRILQRNPLELVICEDLENDQIDLGTVSITLSGSMGFTNAVSHHFYGKGYEPYSHMVENVFEVKDVNDDRTIGEIFLRLKLTCHGPEIKRVNRIMSQPPDQSQLQPIFINKNCFDYPLDKTIIQPPPKMMYTNTDIQGNEVRQLNPDIEKLLQCQRSQNLSEIKPCVCACKELLENVKKVLYRDEKGHSCESTS